MISQGTISVVLGCHSPLHTALVIKAWKEVHGHWPGWREAVCIALHDVGHIGKNYLDDPKQKAEHWRLGAEVAGVLFGWDGFLLVAGHCQDSGYPRSDLYLPDKVSWAKAPWLWLVWNCVVEPKIRGGEPLFQHVRKFRKWTRRNVESGAPVDTHHAYLETVKNGGRL